jgi:ElaB/YqjD/DUF883 family membrane-anchored ribosome-binding protein
MEQALSNNEKIAEALKLLEEAAKGKKDELRNLVTDKYQHLKTALGETEHNVAETLAAAKKRAMEVALHAKEVGTDQAKKIAAEVDEQVHENPWPYIGGVAVAALLIGFLLGRSK